MSVSKKPMVLVILDGYGYREEQQDNQGQSEQDSRCDIHDI